MNNRAGSAPPTASTKQFDWPVCYDAEKLLHQRLDDFLQRNSFARGLAQRMRDESGTRFLDWVDYFLLPSRDEPFLRDAGFAGDSLAETEADGLAWHHPAAMFPHVLLTSSEAGPLIGVAIRVERLADFVAAHHLNTKPEGDSLGHFRRVIVSEERGARFEAIERRGYRGFVPIQAQPGQASALFDAHDLWAGRRRLFDDSGEGFCESYGLIDRLLDLVGRNLACHVVFAEERAYWQQRNRAAQVQKARQDKLGLGWANHDHHTFRCSREHFIEFVGALERLGFERRERLFAGPQAGWGAQIFEQPVEGIVVAAGVDLLPEETVIDFSRHPLPPASSLGDVGLWVGLHGESFLEAGLHQLDARFDFNLAREQLDTAGFGALTPCSEFDFFKQAFTAGERWLVRPERAEKLLVSGLVTKAQFDRFIADGAPGSHLAALERRGGFKGFNQAAASAVVAATPTANRTAPDEI